MREGRKTHLIGVSAGGGASHKLSIKSKTEAEWNGRSHHRFSPFCATKHMERKGQGGKGHKPPGTWHSNRWTYLGAISEVVFKVHVPYLPGVSLPLPFTSPQDLNPQRKLIQAGVEFETQEMKPALKRRCLLCKRLTSCILQSLVCSMVTTQMKTDNCPVPCPSLPTLWDKFPGCELDALTQEAGKTTDFFV